MPTTFDSVVLEYDQPSYAAGETITADLSGIAVVENEFPGPVEYMVEPDGGVEQVPEGSTLVVSYGEAVLIDTSRPIADTGPTPREWTVSSDKTSVSATA
jgi:hypothetical protein